MKAAALLAVALGALAFASPAQAASDEASPAATLSAGDRIAVSVLGQPEMSIEMLIDGSGTVVFPLVGRLRVADLTISECENVIAARLSEGFLRQPVVNVRVSEARPVYILGDVRSPAHSPSATAARSSVRWPSQAVSARPSR